MSEMGDFWRDVDAERQEKRHSNMNHNSATLSAKGVKYIEKPNGHFIILDTNEKPTHDFWASTGLIIERGTNKRSRGIKNLLRFIGH